MQKNILFRGCTRPAMLFGVPYVPFFIGAGGCVLMAMYIDLRFLLLVPIIIFIMRQIARRDELIFRLIGLRLQARTKVRNIGDHDGLWVFTPNPYRDKSSKRRK